MLIMFWPSTGLLLIEIATLFAISARAHECIHGEVVADLKLTANPHGMHGGTPNVPINRLLKTVFYRGITIKVDYSGIDTSASIAAIIKTLFNVNIVPRLQSMLKVTGTAVISPFSKTSCDGTATFPKSYSNVQTVADLLIYVRTVSNTTSPYLAYAMACNLDSFTNRPNIGMMTINTASLKISSADDLDNLSATMLHEMIHVLGLSPSLFPFYTESQPSTVNVTVLSKSGNFTNIYGLITPNLINSAKKYFGCNTINSVVLENQGADMSKNTHFEKRTFGNELMTSQMTGKPAMSLFTLNLLLDTGWYQVDMNQAEQFSWGANKGCDFMTTQCSTQYPEFCTSSKSLGCTPDYSAKSYCYYSSLSDSCGISEYVSGYLCSSGVVHISTSKFEQYGGSSRCFMTNYQGKSVPGCYKAQCLNGAIQISVSNNTYSCRQTGDIITVDNELKITCPNIQNLCSQISSSCPNDCSGLGVCRSNKTCICDIFSQNDNCSDTKTCTYDSSVCQYSPVANGTTVYTITESEDVLKALFLLLLGLKLLLI